MKSKWISRRPGFLLIFFFLWSSVTSQSTTDSPIQLFTSDPSCTGLDMCLNNGTCEEVEDWECSSDPGTGPLRCRCLPGFTGSRCEDAINATSCSNPPNQCLASERCVCGSGSNCTCEPNGAPICKTGVERIDFRDKTYDFQDPIVCLDMYFTNHSSLCYDPDDSLIFSIPQQSVPDFFCLVIDYQTWKTCLRVNKTFQHVKFDAVHNVTITARENIYGEDAVNSSLNLEVIFNYAPIVNNTVVEWQINVGDATLSQFTLDMAKAAGVSDPDGKDLNYSVTSRDNLLAFSWNNSFVTIVPTSRNEQRQTANLFVQVTDEGMPKLSTNFTITVQLLYLRCLPTMQPLLADINVASRQLVGQLVCKSTPGYILQYSKPLPSGNSFSVDMNNEYVYVTSGSPGEYNISIPVQLEGTDILVTWTALLYIKYHRTIRFVREDALWKETLANTSSSDFIELQTNTTTEVLSNVSTLSSDLTYAVHQFRPAQSVYVEGILSSVNNAALDIAVTRLSDWAKTGFIGAMPVNNSIFEIYNQMGFLKVSSLVLSAPANISDVPTNNTDITVTCTVESFVTVGNVMAGWTLLSAPVQPFPFSRFQTSLSSTGKGFTESVFSASPVYFKDRGTLECRPYTDTGLSTVESLQLNVVATPRVELDQVGTLYIERGQDVHLNCSVLDAVPADLVIFDENNSTVASENNSLGLSIVISVTSNKRYSCLGSNALGRGAVSTVSVVVFTDTSTCNKERDNRGVSWAETPSGSLATTRCPQNYTGIATRQCSLSGNFETADYSQCVRDGLLELQNQVTRLQDGLQVAKPVHIIGNVTSLSDAQNPPMEASELSAVTSVMRELTSVVEASNVTEVEATEMANEYVQTASNLLESRQTDSWKTLESKSNETVVTLFSAMDDVTKVLGDKLTSGNSTTITSEKVEVLIGKSKNRNSADIRFPDLTSTHLLVTGRQLDDITRVSGPLIYSTLYYKDVLEILPNATTETAQITGKQINSDVLAMNIFGVNVSAQSVIALTFIHKNLTFDEPVCGFWNVIKSKWDTEGCRTSAGNETFTECRCDHLTNFALLMSPYVKITLELQLITYVGCGVSLFCLILTLIIYASVWNYVKSDRAILLVNLCVSLILAYTVFLAGVTQTQNQAACTAVAAMLHFFFLAVFFLMLAEGLEVFATIITVFTVRSRRKELLLLGWGLPLVVVGISMGATQLRGYGNEKFCWLSINDGLLWAFVGPALAVILINFCIMIKIIYTLLHTRTMVTKEVKVKARAALKSIAVLLPVMGITWVFGILSVNEDTVWFGYIFAVLNSLQGLFIFIFHCAINKKVREGLRNGVRKFRSRHSDFSLLRGSRTKGQTSSKHRKNEENRGQGESSAFRGLLDPSSSPRMSGSFHGSELHDNVLNEPDDFRRGSLASTHFQPGPYRQHFAPTPDNYTFDKNFGQRSSPPGSDRISIRDMRESPRGGLPRLGIVREQSPPTGEDDLFPRRKRNSGTSSWDEVVENFSLNHHTSRKNFTEDGTNDYRIRRESAKDLTRSEVQFPYGENFSTNAFSPSVNFNRGPMPSDGRLGASSSRMMPPRLGPSTRPFNPSAWRP